MGFLIVTLNQIIDMLKYPIALLFLILTYELFHVLYGYLEYMYLHQELYKNLFIGMIAYVISWVLIFRNTNGNWFLVIEHELTHTLFALLTFHRIVDFRATESMGGYIQYSGKGNGNWLILIAPYFFPTFSMIIAILIYFSSPEHYSILLMFLGYTLVYHIHSTYVETSPRQSDLKVVGLWFSWFFLPSANLLAIIAIISAVPNDEIDFFHTLKYLGSHLAQLITSISKFFI